MSNTKLKTEGARFEGEALALAFFDSNFDNTYRQLLLIFIEVVVHVVALRIVINESSLRWP